MKPNLFIFIVSVCVIIFVHYLEYIGFTPCQLCFYQRWPWYLIILLSFISIFYNNRIYPYNKFIIFVLFIGSAAYAAWHAGIEWAFWQGPSTCATGTDKIESHDDLLENIQSIQSFVPCNEASFRFLGLSLAGYNFISSLIMSIYTFLFLRNENE